LSPFPEWQYDSACPVLGEIFRVPHLIDDEVNILGIAKTRSEAFPIASIGNLLSPNELRIAIALRTGAKIF